MSMDLDASYEHCQRLASRAASSFCWAFRLLPWDKRRAMYALYAFSRITDDLGDGGEPIEDRRRRLDAWRGALEQALRGQADDPLWHALHDTIQRFQVPPQHLFAIVDGVAMDLQDSRYETFADLRVYCRRVASAVGFACVQIWGYRDANVFPLAEECGIALQMTNILRDLREDIDRDRVYLPLEDLRRFDYSIDDLRQGVLDARYRQLMCFEIDRTERLYRQSRDILGQLHGGGRRTCAVMLATYRGLLLEIKRRNGDVFSRRIRLSPARKFAVLARGLASSLVPGA